MDHLDSPPVLHVPTVKLPEHAIVYSGYRLFDWETGTTVAQFSDFCRKYEVAPWIAVLTYMMVVFAGMQIMKNRPAFSLRGPLFLWNLSLAAFSVFGFYRMQQEFRFTYEANGWKATYCNKSSDNVVGFWIFVFVMSKFAEFGDTVFLILRKKPVIFLHWYHHVTVLLFSYFTAIDWSSNGRWFVLMNYFVHSLMYTYYALQAAGIRVPRSMAMPLTILQIMQMFLGIYVISASAVEAMKENFTCLNSHRVLTSGFLMYASYLILFINFFLKNYVFARKKEDKKNVNGSSSSSRMNGIKEH